MVCLLDVEELITTKMEAANGSFFAPYDESELSKIKVAVGSFEEDSKEYGAAIVLQNYIYTLAHEMAHYEQWIGKRPFRERLAIKRGAELVDKFIEDQIEYISNELSPAHQLPHMKEYYNVSILNVCLEMIERMGELNTTETMDWFLSLTKDKNEWIRYKVVMELRNFEGKKVVEALIERLSNDVNPTIQAYAAESLQYHKDKSSVMSLFHALDHKEPEVRGCAAVALGWMEERSAIASIKEKLKKERSPRAKMRFYVALYLFGEKEHIHNICSFLTNRSPYIRESAAGYIFLLPINSEIKKTKLEEVWEQETVDWVKSSISDKLQMLE